MNEQNRLSIEINVENKDEIRIDIPRVEMDEKRFATAIYNTAKILKKLSEKFNRKYDHSNRNIEKLDKILERTIEDMDREI